MNSLLTTNTNNYVFVSYNNNDFKKTSFTLSNEEVYSLIEFLTEGFEEGHSENNPVWKGISSDGIEIQIVMPPVSIGDRPVVSLYRKN